MSVWIVPLTLAGAPMRREFGEGDDRRQTLALWKSFFRDHVLYVRSEGEEVKIVRSSRTELAYRCPPAPMAGAGLANQVYRPEEGAPSGAIMQAAMG